MQQTDSTTVELELTVTFYDYWHCGAGESAGSKADALILKDEHNLPYIPGKTLKGHIREMAETLDNHEDFVNRCFGRSTFGESVSPTATKEREGKCYFGNAVLEEHIAPELIPYLYTTITSTAIESNGIAKTGSLREIEAVVPLTLKAYITNVPTEYQVQMCQAIRQVKRIGLNRTRGWGRCEIRVITKGDCNA